jgi:hypothetical protein
VIASSEARYPVTGGARAVRATLRSSATIMPKAAIARDATTIFWQEHGDSPLTGPRPDAGVKTIPASVVAGGARSLDNTLCKTLG